MTERKPRGDRARRRAVRAHSARTGVPYSVAARELAQAGRVLGESASLGRTLYPVAGDPTRRDWVRLREQRGFAERLLDARLAAVLPSGRAAHLAERIPATRGLPHTGVGLLYHGRCRADALAMIYIAAGHGAPGFQPSLGELAWAAESGEETAVDAVCAELDRDARRLLDDDAPVELVRAALVAGERRGDWRLQLECGRLRPTFEALASGGGAPFAGSAQILDALLVVADDGHAPGTRVRAARSGVGRHGTIVTVHWGPSGPPVSYGVKFDDARTRARLAPEELLVLPGQDAHSPEGSRGDGIPPVHIG